MLESLVERVRDPRAGAVVTFSGVTRDVPELDYEAYVPMAEREIAGIVAEAISDTDFARPPPSTVWESFPCPKPP